MRGVRPVPAALPDVPADRRGVGIASRTDRGDAFGRRGHGRGRRHVRDVHGPLPRVPRVRGRLPLARAVRPDDGARPRAGRAAPTPARAVPCGGSVSTSCSRTARCCGSRRSSSRSVRPFLPQRIRALAPRAARAFATAAARRPNRRRERTSAARWPCSPAACRTGGSARSTAPRSACSRATAGASSCRVSQRCCGALRRTTDGSTRRAGSRGATRARSPGVDHVIVNAAGCGAHLQELRRARREGAALARSTT